MLFYFILIYCKWVNRLTSSGTRISKATLTLTFDVSALILLPVENLSPEMDSAIPISYIGREHFAYKPTFKGILSKLVKNRK